MSSGKVSLQYAQVPFAVKMSSDEGSGVSPNNLSTWRPNFGPDRNAWFYLGQSWATDHNPAQPPEALIVQAIDYDALIPVDNWVKVWDNSGSGATGDYSLWRGIPPNDNYVVVGGIFSNNHGYVEPDKMETGRIVAVRKDLVVSGGVLGMTWKDQNSGAAANGSTWAFNRYSGNSGKVLTNCLIPQSGWSEPPSDMVWSLNPAKCQKVTAA